MRIGIDIGGTKTSVIAVDEGGAVLSESRAPSGRGPHAVVDVAVALADEAIAASGGRDAVTSIGACMPGIVDPARGVVRHAVNLGVEELRLGPELAARLGRPVVIGNDVKAAALWAHRAAAPPAGATMGYLNLGTGLAAALVIDGVVAPGLAQSAGEIGHIPVGGPTTCHCGQVGCLETIASGRALARSWQAVDPALSNPFAAAAAGDEAAHRAVTSLCEGVALAIQILVLAAGVSQVVVGGGVVGLGGPLHTGIERELDRRAEQSPFLRPLALARRFSLLDPGVPVAALGATLLGMNQTA
ncbi:MAG: ROK family protein [Candidatus Lutibacillus vidarii]|jgi:predicted NBD/HSP70 family sugar kinase|nr:ROK family protein [Candidatus Lutibacillus vidarii]